MDLLHDHTQVYKLRSHMGFALPLRHTHQPSGSLPGRAPAPLCTPSTPAPLDISNLLVNLLVCDSILTLLSMQFYRAIVVALTYVLLNKIVQSKFGWPSLRCVCGDVFTALRDVEPSGCAFAWLLLLNPRSKLDYMKVCALPPQGGKEHHSSKFE